MSVSLKKLLDAASKQATADIKTKWIYFNREIKFKDTVPLHEKISAFSIPIQTFVEENYPAISIGGGNLFWMTIFNAIMESGTHSTAELNAAIDELRKLYAS